MSDILTLIIFLNIGNYSTSLLTTTSNYEIPINSLTDELIGMTACRGVSVKKTEKVMRRFRRITFSVFFISISQFPSFPTTMVVGNLLEAFFDE